MASNAIVLSFLAASLTLLSTLAHADVRAGQRLIENLDCTGVTPYGTHVSLVATHDENHLMTGLLFSERQYGMGVTEETARGYQTRLPVTVMREIAILQPLANLEGASRLSLIRAVPGRQFNRFSPALAESVAFSGFLGAGTLNAQLVIHSDPNEGRIEDEGQQIQLSCRF